MIAQLTKWLAAQQGHQPAWSPSGAVQRRFALVVHGYLLEQTWRQQVDLALRGNTRWIPEPEVTLTTPTGERIAYVPPPGVSTVTIDFADAD